MNAQDNITFDSAADDERRQEAVAAILHQVDETLAELEYIRAGRAAEVERKYAVKSIFGGGR